MAGSTGSGGYRKPSSPAPVSGPGAMSKRTDGQPSRYVEGLPYGEGQELMTTQGSAPMSGASPSGGQAPAGIPLAQMSPDLFSPSDYPNEPVTAGMNMGAGPGREALSAGMPQGPSQRRIAAMLPIYIELAETPYVSQEFKALVHEMRSNLSG